MNNLKLRKSDSSDFRFLREMLYEAVFWRDVDNRPSFEKGLSYPEVSKALKDWGKREGDIAVIAVLNSKPIGAAWFRFWSDDNTIRGYIKENIPVLAIGVHSDYRHQGIGRKMLNWLIEYSYKNSIEKISLSVTKDNYALNLYRQVGFVEYRDMGDWFVMVCDVNKVI